MRLADLYPQLNASERTAIADKCGTTPAYLWQLSTRWRGRRPSVELLSKLAEADRRLNVSDMLAEFSEVSA